MLYINGEYFRHTVDLITHNSF